MAGCVCHRFILRHAGRKGSCAAQAFPGGRHRTDAARVSLMADYSTLPIFCTAAISLAPSLSMNALNASASR